MDAATCLRKSRLEAQAAGAGENYAPVRTLQPELRIRMQGFFCKSTWKTKPLRNRPADCHKRRGFCFSERDRATLSVQFQQRSTL
jgi:hypothetical protein